MNALDVALLPQSLPFSVALCTMVLIGVVSLLGIDQDVDADIHLSLLDWMNPGRLPILMTATVFLGFYGATGIALQEILISASGHPLPTWIAGLAAIVPGLVLTSPTSLVIAKILPREETTAITLDQLVGTRGVIEYGVATADRPARARFKDRHGRDHHIMVAPADPEHQYPADTEVVLATYSPDGSTAIPAGAWPPARL